MDSFQYYMKQQLKRYIAQEEKKGVPLEHIETVLLNAGHEKNILDECFSELSNEEVGIEVAKPKDKVENEMVNNLMGSVKGFFGNISSGEAKSVKKDLKKASTENIVEEAIEEYEVEKETYIMEGVVFFLYLAALVVLTLVTASKTGDELIFVAVGFAPSFINSFISFALVKFTDYVPIFMLIPVVVSGAFYALGATGKLTLTKNMEVEAIAIINVVISLFFNLALILVTSFKPKPITRFPDREPSADKKKAPAAFGQAQNAAATQYSHHNYSASNTNPVYAHSYVDSRKQTSAKNSIDSLKKSFNFR
ncbi:MAG: hypothetical protein V1859_06605 [archaeon]